LKRKRALRRRPERPFLLGPLPVLDIGVDTDVGRRYVFATGRHSLKCPARSGEIGTGTKCGASTGEDDDADIVIGIEPGIHVGELDDSPNSQRITTIWPVERDGRDTVLQVDEKGRVRSVWHRGESFHFASCATSSRLTQLLTGEIVLEVPPRGTVWT
jgi:hypothetical protein